MNRYVLSVSRYLIPSFMTACWATASLAQQGPPGGLNVNVLNTPLSVTVTNPTVPPSTVNIGNPAALATANAQALRIGTPVLLSFGSLTQPSMSYSVPAGKLLV